MKRLDTWTVIRATLVVLVAGTVLSLIVLSAKFASEPLSGGGSGQKPPPPPPNVKKFPYAFTSNEECRDCHLEIWEEWQTDQHSQAWFNRPFLPQDPKRTECNSCHAPRPILEVGYLKPAEIRASRFEEGVGCIECHQNHDRVEGPLPTAEAACNPVENPVFSQTEICVACHAAHGTYDEWKGTKWAKDGVTCQDCHMPLVERPASTGGPVRKVHSHKMRSQRDITMIQEALELDVKIVEGKVVVSLTNSGTAHNCPGEIYNRDLVLKTVVFDEEENQVNSYRESHKTVRREQRGSIPSTQLKPNETRTYTYELGAEHGKVWAVVIYKFLFMWGDEWLQPGMVEKVHEKLIDF
ncbi:MAG: NapC/NirT family cytochrome c [Planctomycetota bacterium]|jgi:nitrate/TMAO reductase-like tetraheme cytochrome c subunit